MRKRSSFLTILVAVGVIIAAAVTIRLDTQRIDDLERSLQDFRTETQSNFDSLRAEVLENRVEIGKCQQKLDTVIAGEVVIYNEVKNLNKEEPKRGTPHDFLESIRNFLGL